MELPDGLRPTGPGRFAFTMSTPWGQSVPAELLLTTRRGWAERDESRDRRWTVYAVGPAMVAIRLLPAPEPKARAGEGVEPGPSGRRRRGGRRRSVAEAALGAVGLTLAAGRRGPR